MLYHNHIIFSIGFINISPLLFISSLYFIYTNTHAQGYMKLYFNESQLQIFKIFVFKVCIMVLITDCYLLLHYENVFKKLFLLESIKKRYIIIEHYVLVFWISKLNLNIFVFECYKNIYIQRVFTNIKVWVSVLY